MPCSNLLSDGFILNQPFSSLLVYLLAAMWIWAGWKFWATQNQQKSRFWWALTLFFGGIAALSAGTSYQACGQKLKCDGRELCIWTTWWEVAFMVLHMASLSSMLMAVAYSSTTARLQKGLLAYAWFIFFMHL